jgi:hypothetical protein
LASDEKQLVLWEVLPAPFVEKWSIEGHGWVRIIGLPLRCLLTDTENARPKLVNFKNSVLLY